MSGRKLIVATLAATCLIAGLARGGDEAAAERELLELGGPFLAAHPLVVRELRLDRERASRVEWIVRAGRSRWRAVPDGYEWSRRYWDSPSVQRYRGAPPVAIGALVGQDRAHIAEEVRAELGAVLDVRQRARLDELGLQARGLGAFDDPAIQRRLFLTPTQREKIEALLRAWRRGERSEAATYEPLFAVLTRTQGGVWVKLAGRPLVPPFSPGYAAVYARLAAPGPPGR